MIVAIYHFQHFGAISQDPLSWHVDVTSLPFYFILKPVYIYGWMAVDFFFAISGFVFFCKYRQLVHHQHISFSKFSMLRLSRLYPLHILTLLMAVALQWQYRESSGQFFIAPYNDFHHFLLNVFFAQGLGLGKGPSFNDPSWSISVEVLLYLIFFLFAGSRFSASFVAVLFVIGFGLLIQGFNAPIGRGIASFFSGGLVFFGVKVVAERDDKESIVIRSIYLATAATALVIFASYTDFISWLVNAFHLERYEILANKAGSRFTIYVVFDLIIFAVASFELVFGQSWSRLSFLGEISYSSYLIHFPLQLVFAIFTLHGFFSLSWVDGPWSLLLFMLLLIPLSWLTYRHFELPMQRRWRSKLSSRL